MTLCLMANHVAQFLLKFIVAFWITAINISVYCIWVPAKLQISGRYHDINVWWDRIEVRLSAVHAGCETNPHSRKSFI